MSSQLSTGERIREIKQRSGLSWDALARRLGASSGDYVRKVASGARPGNNLARAVDELMTAGRVQSVVERRRTAAGELARVRAPRAAGAKSVTPTQQQLDPTRGYLSVGPAGSLRWSGEFGAGERAAILREVRAARDARKRVSFRLHYVDKNGRDVYVQVGSKDGYDPRRALQGMRAMNVADWLMSQSKGRKYAPLDASFIGVEVYAT